MVRHIFSVFVINRRGTSLHGLSAIWNTETSGKSAGADELYKAAEADFQRRITNKR